MALVLADRVQQTGTANTTVSFTLSGSVTGFQSFAVVGNGNTAYYAAFDSAGNWETGLGTYSTTGPTLTRTTIYQSSNSNTAVTFSGTVNIFVTYPSGRSVNLDASNNVSALGTVASGTWQGSVVAATYGGSGVAGTLTGLLYGNGTGAYTVATTAQALTLIGTVPIANGGTNSTATPTAGGAGYGTGTAHAYTAVGTSGNALISAGASAPAFGNLALGTANTNVSGALTATNGGTGVATLTGVAYGNGTSAFTAATAAQLTSAMGVASTSTNGYLSSTDWNTFNGKQAAGTYVTSVSGTAPVVSSGGTTPAISMAAATTSVSGYLTSTDWNTFNGKSPAAGSASITTTGTVTSGTWSASFGAVSGANLTSITGANVTGTVANATAAVTFSSTTQNSQFNSLGVGTAGSTTAGEIRATNNVTAYYSSDRTLKENIQDIPNALEIVNAIGTKTFDWTDAYLEVHGGEDGYFVQKSDFGVIAQDVQKVFPIAVRTREDGTLAVDYEKLGTLAFAAIGQLLKRVEALEAR